MFDSLVGILQFSFYIIVFTFIPLMLVMRLLSALKLEKALKVRLLVIFDITSVSYYYFLETKDLYRKIYNILMIIYLVFSLLALAFGLHMYL